MSSKFSYVFLLLASERQLQAKCLGLAALLGDDVYNIGELVNIFTVLFLCLTDCFFQLAHPVLKSLQSSDKWLYDLLYAFNSGNITKFEEFRPVWSKNDDLRKESALLERKIRLLGLMEMAFARPSKDRQIAFADVAAATKVDIGEVNQLLSPYVATFLLLG